jgi:hypothetical protein
MYEAKAQADLNNTVRRCSLKRAETSAERSEWSYDKVPEAVYFRALAQNSQFKIIESKDAISMIRRDMSSFDARVLS